MPSSTANAPESMPSYTLSLGRPASNLATVGGKGAALARLIEAGFNVPSGFHVTTSVYRRFVDANGLQTVIESATAGLDASDRRRLEQAAQEINDAFADATLPHDVEQAVLAAYSGLPGDDPAVAVRSSATAEDLPDLSFAGQQETSLNVRGESALLEAVQRCWASLWSNRAISYRALHEVPADGVAMAVVVQLMVPAESAGIAFTANPLNGRRDQVLINASWGLGESVVGGQVTPDTMVANKSDGTVVSRETATKTVMTVAADQGAFEEAVPAEMRDRAVLDDAAVAELVALGRRVEDLFGQPMDIEWAYSEGSCALLQARPITALSDVPLEAVWEPPVPGSGYIRRQVVEHMPDPLSPLFAELYLEEGLETSIDVLLEHMGFDIEIINRMVQRPLFDTVNGFAYMRVDYRVSLSIIPRIVVPYLKFVRSILSNPVAYWQNEQVLAYLAKIGEWRQTDLAEATDQHLLAGVSELAEADAVYWFAANIPLGLSKVTDGLLERLLRSQKVPRDADGEGPALAVTSGELLRGIPSKPLEAQIALETVARQIADDPQLRDRVIECRAADLPSVLGEGTAGEAVLEALEDYLEQFGHQIYTLDFVVPTQAEDPLPVLMGLQALVEHPGHGVQTKQAAFAKQREALTESTARRFGPIRRPIYRKALGWAQRFTPYREDAIYYVGAAWPALRRLALELGRRLAEVGTLDAPEAVFYLRSDEISSAIAAREDGEARPELGELAGERLALREKRMNLLPPATVPADYRYKIGPISMDIFTPKKNVVQGDTLEGFAVSPGRVTAPASVILSPSDFENMQSGTILVCPTTTPAWTPLFAQAAGLVTDIGGVLAHGSIVAREYGIPAVMGTTVATDRIRSGQTLTVDGAAGTVEINTD